MKPFIEEKDSANRPDKEVAAEFWDAFVQREQSIFVKLFYGQLKSCLTCAECEKVSIKFDQFSVLSVPIPSITSKHGKEKAREKRELIVEFYPFSLRKTSIVYKTEFTQDFVTVSDVRMQLIKKLKESGLMTADDSKPLLCFSKNDAIINLPPPGLMLNDVKNIC